jgi:polyphosphate kinase
LNALTDPALIHALIQASQAGASIDLIVRGACMLPPGLAGFTERIRVRSIVGRFLEHTRIIYFCWGNGPEDEALYLSSADWMDRNFFRRVETAVPVLRPTHRARILRDLGAYLADNTDAWLMREDGTYVRAVPAAGEEPFTAQTFLLEHYRAPS